LSEKILEEEAKYNGDVEEIPKIFIDKGYNGSNTLVRPDEVNNGTWSHEHSSYRYIVEKIFAYSNVWEFNNQQNRDNYLIHTMGLKIIFELINMKIKKFPLASKFKKFII
jgi:hypothetical protein